MRKKYSSFSWRGGGGGKHGQAFVLLTPSVPSLKPHLSSNHQLLPTLEAPSHPNIPLLPQFSTTGLPGPPSAM